MKPILQRREFMKTASLMGASMMIDPYRVFTGTMDNSPRGQVKSEHCSALFDQQTGRIAVFKNDGSPIITGGTVAVNTPLRKISVLPGRYTFSLDSKRFEDSAGTGNRLVILCSDADKQFDLEIRISLHDRIDAFTIEVLFKNISPYDITVKSIEPIRVVAEEGGRMYTPGVTKCITNGVMYYDAGTIHEFGTPFQASGGIQVAKLANTSISSSGETVRSWWNAGLFGGYGHQGTAIGYLDNESGLGNLLLSQPAPDLISFVAETAYMPEVVVPPGKSVGSNRLMVITASDPYSALDQYAAVVGTLNNARTRSIVNGWCSWFYTLSQVSEDEVIRNTEFASKHLKQFGLEYIQIDEGYQRWHGDWDGNDRFPHGMKWLAEKIRGYGFKAGLWVSPYIISQPTDVFQKHPEWLLKDKDGNPKRIGNWEGDVPDWAANENPKRYCLDITHPGAAQWMHELFRTVSHDWGYEMIKIDFMAWSILAADRYYDPTRSSAQVYRKGLEIMRAGAGEKCHILECGPGAVTVGLIDSMRIEADINYGYADAEWKTYFQDPACSASAAGKRYYFHKRTWVNDADHICMDLLTNRQAEAAATIIALSGGNMISGDRLIELGEYKLEILKKITPSYGAAALPVDLFDGAMPSVFAAKVKKPFGEWTIAGFFNESLTERMEKKFSLQRLELDPDKTYHVFDFWKQRYVGEITGEIAIGTKSGSVTLLSIHEKTGASQFLSTDRHVFQGAVEVEDIVVDTVAKTISGISTGPLHSSHNVFLYISGDHPWTWGGYVLFRDYESYSAKLIDNNIVRVHIDFKNSTRIRWSFPYDDFFK